MGKTKPKASSGVYLVMATVLQLQMPAQDQVHSIADQTLDLIEANLELLQQIMENIQSLMESIDLSQGGSAEVS